MRDEFDVVALQEAVDRRRRQTGLTWRAVADEMWQQSAVLNARRNDHPISRATISGMADRRDISCQHALVVLRWLGETPEHFVADAVGGARDIPLPVAGPDRRLRWDLNRLYAATDEERRRRKLTWGALAADVGCTPNQLTGLRTARFATGMRVAMQLVGWLDRPSADFVVASAW